MNNTYSDAWYATFLDTIPRTQTETEVRFVARHFPRPRFSRLLDVGCGTGRHAVPLAARRYWVAGIDTNPVALAHARVRSHASLVFLEHDMRQIEKLPYAFDGVLFLWQTFGYGDDETNADVLRQVVAKLQPGGRVLIDAYNRDAMARSPMSRQLARGGTVVREERELRGRRLAVQLHYDDDKPSDQFEWRVYTPSELRELATRVGLWTVLECAVWDETVRPSAEHARMQMVFETS